MGAYSFGNTTQPAYVELSSTAGATPAVADAVRLVKRTDPEALRVTTEFLLPAQVNVAYQTQCDAAGGIGLYHWRVANGQFPEGLSLSATTGMITGVPTRLGRFSFVIEVQDVTGGMARRELSISIDAMPPPAALILDNGGVGTSVTAGTWKTYVTDAQQRYGTDWAAGTSAGIDIYRFTPTISRPGQYRVFGRWVTHANRSTRAPFDIHHADGISTVEVDQTLNGGQWNPLGVYTFTPGAGGYVELADRNGPYVVADAVMYQYIGDPVGYVPPAIVTMSLPNADLGVPYSGGLIVLGGTPPYRWAIVSGALPAGLTLNPDSGVVGGTPQASGSFVLSVQVTDAADDIATQSFSLTVNFILPADLILDNSTAGTQVSAGTWKTYTTDPGQAYGANWAAGIGAGIDRYRFTPMIPYRGQYRVLARWVSHPNRSLRAAYDIHHASGSSTVEVNQQLSGGQWNTLGVYTFAIGSAGYVEVSDRNGQYVVADAVMFQYVSEPSGAIPLSIATTTLTNAELGTNYSAALVASGANPPYRWSVLSAALPAGLTLNADTGIVAGTPQASGAFALTMQVTDTTMATATQALTLTVTFNPPADITVDNGTAGTQARAGTWKAYSTDPAQKYGADWLAGVDSGVDSYRFTPTITHAGRYRVLARWITHPNRSLRAPYDIHHASGTSTVEVNQQLNGGQWNILGVYTFAVGSGGYVELSDRNGPFVVGDAVMFQYVGE